MNSDTQPQAPAATPPDGRHAGATPALLPGPAEAGALLYLELMPSTCWGSNFRNLVTVGAWNRIRRAAYQAAGHRCEICGGVGRRHPVECHERWSYDDEAHVQHLAGFIALCPACHAVKHLGRTATVARDEHKDWMIEAAVRHVRWVNGWSVRQLEEAYDAAWRQWAQRSRHTWRLDLAVLPDFGFRAAEILALEDDAARIRQSVDAE